MKFSVLIPTRNRLQYLKQAVQTVVRQDYTEWEVVISDNHSDEDVASWVRSFGDEPRIRYYRTDRFISVTENWNNALEKSTGDYVIMLGDDDGLMPGYFSTLKRLIDDFERPDVVYTGAFIFAYPGALPGLPLGRLTSHAHVFADSGGEPFWLERGRAHELVRHTLNFRAFFGFNAQFFLVRRRAIDELSPDGPFYRSPFPDYYSSNLLLLHAERILVYPRPLVIIGISPKSYGYFHFNQQETEGIAFLNAVPDGATAERLKNVVLPGTNINNGWLFAMEALKTKLQGERRLRINYRHYRCLQAIHVFEAVRFERRLPEDEWRRLMVRLRPHERFFFSVGPALDAVLNRVVFREAFPRVTARLLRAAKRWLNQFPDFPYKEADGSFCDLLEVFARVDPQSSALVPGATGGQPRDRQPG